MIFCEYGLCRDNNVSPQCCVASQKRNPLVRYKDWAENEAVDTQIKTWQDLQKAILKMTSKTVYLDAKYKEMRSDLSLFTVF